MRSRPYNLHAAGIAPSFILNAIGMAPPPYIAKSFNTPHTVRYPAKPSALTHGWRWWRVEGGALWSPLQGRYITGELKGRTIAGAFFIPGVDEIFSMVQMLTHQKPYPFAITYGSVTGPFTPDRQMPRVGSMQCGEYRILHIFASERTSGGVSAAALGARYGVPATGQLLKSQLKAVAC